jgi:hypothetical protein
MLMLMVAACLQLQLPCAQGAQDSGSEWDPEDEGEAGTGSSDGELEDADGQTGADRGAADGSEVEWEDAAELMQYAEGEAAGDDDHEEDEEELLLDEEEECEEQPPMAAATALTVCTS